MTRLTSVAAAAFMALAAAFPGAAFAQQVFETPKAAAEALIAAAGSGDSEQVFAIFGDGAREVLSSGVDGVDQQSFEEFTDAAGVAANVITREDGETVLYVGISQWPFPVHLVKSAAGWAFDLDGARDEILNRRIGENELDVIETMRIYVTAQREFMIRDPDGDRVMAYADSFISDPGRKNGLYWPVEDGEEPSPFGPLAARAAAEGYEVEGERRDPTPFQGYFYRVLTAQGDSAPGGAMDYMVNGYQLAGFAMIAFPAAYGESGVMSFIVGPAGVIYERDLGEDTAAAAAAIEAFDPDDGWTALSGG